MKVGDKVRVTNELLHRKDVGEIIAIAKDRNRKEYIVQFKETPVNWLSCWRSHLEKA